MPTSYVPGLGLFHYDFEVSAAFRNAMQHLADDTRSLGARWKNQRQIVIAAGFKGGYAETFVHNGDLVARNCSRVADASEDVAATVKLLETEAQEEVDRRTRAQGAWSSLTPEQRLHGMQNPFYHFVPPAPPATQVVHASIVGGFADRPARTTSRAVLAHPEALRDCSRICGGYRAELEGIGQDFTTAFSGFHPGGSPFTSSTIDVAQVKKVFREVCQLAGLDVDWVRTIGKGLEAAGGSATLGQGVSDGLIGALIAGDVEGEKSLLAGVATPQEVADWFKAQDPAVQAELEALQGDALRNLDGIPPAVRDRLNRTYLDQAISEAEQAVAGFSAEVEQPQDFDWDAVTAAVPVHTIHNDLADLLQIKEVLDANVGIIPPMFLLAVEQSGEQVKTVVAIGDVGVSDHVQVFVPGFTSNVRDSLDSYSVNMRNLRRLSARELADQGSSESVASVVWLGYDAPQFTPEQMAGPNSVGATTAARTGAKKLRAFTAGVVAGRMAPTRVNVSLLDHSYGSLPAALALQEPGHGVGKLVVFGSPGMIAKSDDIPNGLAAIANVTTPITNLLAFPTRPKTSSIYLDEGDISHLGAPLDIVDMLGAFGSPWAGQPDVNELSTVTTEGVGVGIIWHSDYLTEGTTSQRNIAWATIGLEHLTVISSPQNINGNIGFDITSLKYEGKR